MQIHRLSDLSTLCQQACCTYQVLLTNSRKRCEIASLLPQDPTLHGAQRATRLSRTSRRLEDKPLHEVPLLPMFSTSASASVCTPPLSGPPTSPFLGSPSYVIQ